MSFDVKNSQFRSILTGNSSKIGDISKKNGDFKGKLADNGSKDGFSAEERPQAPKGTNRPDYAYVAKLFRKV